MKQELRFNKDGTFRILQLSDTQEKGRVADITQTIIRKMVEKSNPDLVIFTGDNIYDDYVYKKLHGKPMDEQGLIEYYRDLSRPMEENGVPWCMVFGNHDSEFLLQFTRSDHMRVCMDNFDHFVGSLGDPDISGDGNYVLSVLRSDSDKIGFNVWALDSGSYLNPEKEGFAESDAVNSSDYDYIHFDQQLWYFNTSKALEENNGEKIPGAMYFHISLPEFLFAAKDLKENDENGYIHDGFTPVPINSGMFSTVLSRGDVKGIYCGHDHSNNFAGRYCGIELGYAGGISYDDYGGWTGHQPDRDTCSGRLLEVNENDAWNFTTKLIYYKNLV